ncbi:MAG: hypothetical protein RIB84_25450 [Sneathiellaceae bacterium]
MPPRTRIKIAALGLATMLALPVLPAFAESKGLCGEPALEGHERKVVSVDHGKDGATLADTRVGRMVMRTADGQVAGEAMWQATMIRNATDARSDAYISDHVFQDDAGVMFGRALHDYAIDFHNPEHRPDEVEVAILGGVGAYRNARGTVDIGLKGPPRYRFHVACE